MRLASFAPTCVREPTIERDFSIQTVGLLQKLATFFEVPMMGSRDWSSWLQVPHLSRRSAGGPNRPLAVGDGR